jgi:GNAT superfamily N-acetyltransferase
MPDRARIAPLRREQLAATAGVLAASLAEDPAWSHILPDPAGRAVALRASLGASIRDALPFGAVYGAIGEGRVVGAAVWLPPGRFPLSPGRKLRCIPAFLPVLGRTPRSFLPLLRLGANVERAFPPGPLGYLEALGVEPAARGRGLGARLLEPALARADQPGVGRRIVQCVGPPGATGSASRSTRKPRRS